MSIDTRSLIEKLNDHLADPKNVADAKAYFARFENRDKMEANQVKRFWKKYNDGNKLIVERILSNMSTMKRAPLYYGKPLETDFIQTFKNKY